MLLLLDVAGDDVGTRDGVGNRARAVAVAHGEHVHARGSQFVKQRAVGGLRQRVDDVVGGDVHLDAALTLDLHALGGDVLHHGIVPELHALGEQIVLAHHARPGGGVHIHLILAARVDDGDGLAHARQTDRRLAALELAAEDDEALPVHPLRQRIGRLHKLEARHVQLRIAAADGDDHAVRRLGLQGFRCRGHAGFHGDADLVQLMDQVVQVVGDALVRALDGRQLAQRQAKAVLLLQQRDGVPALCGDARRLHACGAAADDEHLLLRLRRERIIVLGHVRCEGAGQAGVHAAVHRHAEVIRRDEAGHAARAGGDILLLTSLQLVAVLRIGHQRAGDEDVVHLAVGNRAVDEIGRHARVHRADSADRDAHTGLDLRGDLDERAEAVILALHPGEVLAVVHDRAVAGVAVLLNVQHVRHEARAVVAVRMGADVQAACASLLKQLGEFAGLLDRRAGVVVTEVRDVLLRAAVEHLNDEIAAHARADALDNLGDDAGAVLDGRAAVLVGALIVGEAREEGGEVVAARAVDLDAVVARLFVALRRVDEALNLRLHLLGGLHPAGGEARLHLELVHRRGGRAARHQHVVELADERRALGVHVIGNRLVGRNALVRGDVQRVDARRGRGDAVAALRHARHSGRHIAGCIGRHARHSGGIRRQPGRRTIRGHAGDAAHRPGRQRHDGARLVADHADAAIAELAIIRQRRIAGPDGVVLHFAARRALDDAVLERHMTDLERGEQVGQVAGIRKARRVLRVEECAVGAVLTRGCKARGHRSRSGRLALSLRDRGCAGDGGRRQSGGAGGSALQEAAS